ncbi:hypothetical protein [Chitinophaga varians]|uniref:nSTAND3 domain-containing NTPase n=1 Tax=Chitinophaga varians TaxID=2202339 RepID=UPI00165FE2CD|nr:hypothetical protein [Chitinophaga varians]MBC9909829.1 hypothetical protein [Chitinophaga varians]
MLNRNYNLHSLGWHSFQKLCLSITREILGQTVISFLDTKDGGRDGAFSGIWTPKGMETMSGKFVIQCKFTVRKDKNLTLSDLKDELEKVDRLVKMNMCDCYVVITNSGVSGSTDVKIIQELKKRGVKHAVCYGYTWICDQIHENMKLRTAVPRLYGLGDLSQIIDERAYSQARALLASMQEDLAKIVITESYHKASRALSDHGFVLLIGEPAAGKTTIASMLAMSALDQWSALTLKLDTPQKVIEHWNPDNPNQLFWIDDAFGVTQYESSLVHAWNHVFAQVKTMISQGIKVVMTSRDYIYNAARNDLKDSAFPILKESQVVIDVHDLSLNEKRQILYNHLKLGRQPNSFKKKIKPLLDDIASHKRFVPETARRLSDPAFTRGLQLDYFELMHFVESQEQHLLNTIDGLDSNCKSALGLIYMRNNKLESPIELQESEETALKRLGSSLAGCTSALASLNGSMVHTTSSDSGPFWQFKHPTIGDAYSKILIRNPELMEIYLQGGKIEQLFSQLTCGDIGYVNAIVVPPKLYPLLVSRLQLFTKSGTYKTEHLSLWDAKRRLLRFLTSRCNKDFLVAYIDKNPSLLKQVTEIGLYLDASAELELAIRLYKEGLLPEKERIKIIEILTEYCVTGDDLKALDDRDEASDLFTQSEYDTLLSKVRSGLIHRLADVRSDFESNYDNSMDPDDYMVTFNRSLNILERVFLGEPEVLDACSNERVQVRNWIVEANEDLESSRPKRKLEDASSPIEHTGERSIFEDVDD